MFTRFFQHFNQLVPLTPTEEERIATLLEMRSVSKKEFLLREGEVCKSFAFVESGLLRKYVLDDGAEHVVQFAPEDWTISDLMSFLTEEPSVHNIEALEDSEVVLVSKSAYEELVEHQPKFERYMRILVTNAYIALQRRLSAQINETANQRYEEFMKKYANIAMRVPQHMIASYMGLSPETLSRVRKKIAEDSRD